MRTERTPNPPAPVRELVARLESAGFEAWCVGGAIRDSFLGESHLDWDIATAATPEQVKSLFRRTVPVGIEFGTMGVFDSAGTMHEVTTFRRDVETDGRHAKVKFGVSLEDDLARRDFTVNAMAYSPTRNQLFDPFGGADDLSKGVLRTVGDPKLRMAEDRLRALRALRFSARFGFAIEPATWEAIRGSSRHMERLSAERIRQEIEKTMDQVERPGEAFLNWRDSGAFAVLIPALASASDLELRYADFLPRPGLPGRPARRADRIAALMLAIGPSGAKSVLKALRFSNSDTAWIAGQVERWHYLNPVLEELIADGGLPAPARLRAWISRVGRMRTPSLMRIAISVWRARAARGLAAPSPALHRSLYRVVLRSAFRDPVEIADLALDGDDLRAAGVGAGPAMGRMLSMLLLRVLEDPTLNTRDALLRIAAGAMGSGSGQSKEGGHT